MQAVVGHQLEAIGRLAQQPGAHWLASDDQLMTGFKIRHKAVEGENLLLQRHIGQERQPFALDQDQCRASVKVIQPLA